MSPNCCTLISFFCCVSSYSLSANSWWSTCSELWRSLSEGGGRYTPLWSGRVDREHPPSMPWIRGLKAACTQKKNRSLNAWPPRWLLKHASKTDRDAAANRMWCPSSCWLTNWDGKTAAVSARILLEWNDIMAGALPNLSQYCSEHQMTHL